MKLPTFIGILLLLILAGGGTLMHLVAIGYFEPDPTVEIEPVGGQNGKLTVATDADYWPYSFMDKEGRLSGREVELAYAVANVLGMEIEIRPMKWAECLKLAGEHKVDLVLTCAEYATDCEADDLLFSIPDGADEYMVFGREPLASLKELGKRRLAQMSFGNVNPTLEAAGFGSEIKLYPSNREAFLAVDRGEADYIVIRHTPAVGILKELGLKGIKPQCSAGASCFCIGVNRLKPELLRKVNDAIMVLRVSGETRRLSEKWLSTYVEPDTLAELVAKSPQAFIGFLSLVMLLAVILVWVAHRHSRAATRLQTNLDVIEEVVTGYTAFLYADLETGAYEEYILSERIAESVRQRTKHPLFYDQLHAFFDSEAVHLDSRSALHAFYPSDAAWRERLRDRKKISTVFRRKYDDGVYRWMRMDVIRRGKVGEAVRQVVVAFSDCDAEFHVQNEHLVHEQILETLIRTYFGFNVSVNLETMGVSFQRGVGCDRSCELLAQCETYDRAVEIFSARIADDEHRRQALSMLSAESLRRFAAEGKHGFIGSIEYPVVDDLAKDAQPEWRELNVFLNFNADAVPIVNIVGRDITKIKSRLEAEKKLEVAEAASKARSEFLFNMSHDVRSPMHAIMGFVDMIRQDLSDATRSSDARLLTIQENVGNIQRSGDLLFSLLNSVLDLSRLETGRLKVTESPADVLMAFNGVKSTTLALAKEKNIDLAFAFDEIADRYVYVDIEKANRVFLNILTNAIKYTKEGGRVRARGEQVERGTYRFTFEDNGIGMSPEFQKRLYDRFSREENTTMSGVEGIGLGLSIVKAFVDLLGGTVECQSEKGVGTTFVVTLRCRVQEGTKKCIDPVSGCVLDADAPAAAKVTAANAKPFVGKHVLLVDDSKLNRDVSKYYLKSAGCDVDTAGDGAEAVELVKKNGPGYYYVIMMDVQMPVMGGYEATKHIREWEATQDLASKGLKPVPIIAWSANAFEEDREKALAAGMNDHLAKGAKAAQLREVIAHWGG